MEESGISPRQEREYWARFLGLLRDAWDGLRSVFGEWEWGGVGNGLLSVIKPFVIMLINDGGEETFFVVGSRDDVDVSSGSGLILVTMVFGGIHCIAWSFHFPSPTEQLLWRISSIAITGFPLAFICLFFIVKLDSDNCVIFILTLILTIILFITIILLVFLYPVFRMLLLVLSLSTLRSLPPSAYQTVQWTTFLPHV